MRLNLQQGSPDWHQWRGDGIGGSSAAAIMNEGGFTPYTALDLWRIRTGRKEKPFMGHAAVAYGTQMESVARAMYEQRTGRIVAPACYVHDTLPFLKASTDGSELDDKHFCEIKCPSLEVHTQAMAGEVPRHYWWQMQFYYLVQGAESADYVSYFDFDGLPDLQIIPVERDEEAIVSLIRACSAFYLNLVNDEEPPYTPRDTEDVSEDSEWQTLEQCLRRVRTLKDKALAEEAELIDSMKAVADAREHSVKGSLFHAIRSYHKGSGEYRTQIREVKQNGKSQQS